MIKALAIAGALAFDCGAAAARAPATAPIVAVQQLTPVEAIDEYFEYGACNDMELSYRFDAKSLRRILTVRYGGSDSVLASIVSDPAVSTLAVFGSQFEGLKPLAIYHRNQKSPRASQSELQRIIFLFEAIDEAEGRIPASQYGLPIRMETPPAKDCKFMHQAAQGETHGK